MPSFGHWTLLFSIILHRLIFLGQPHAISRLGNHYFLAMTYGGLSDMALLFFLWGVLALISRLPQRFAQSLDVIVAVGVGLFLGAYSGYYQYFGYPPLPDHFHLLKVSSAWGVSFLFLFQSWRFWVLVLIPVIFGYLFSLGFRRLSFTTRVVLPLFLLSLSLHFLHRLTLRDPRVHDDLLWNPFLASISQFPIPWGRGAETFSPKEGQALRSRLSLQRDWADPSGEYPLWQQQNPSKTPLSPLHAKVRDGFRAFLREQEHFHGPWNVIVVLQESLRANELKAEMTPKIASLKQTNGVSFQETYHVGMGSEIGVSAALCSVGPINIMGTSSRKKIICLSDLFSEKGYETFYFFGASGVWSNIQSFFTYHLVDRFIAKNDFPPTVKKGIFGISDNELFLQSLTHLRKAERPFFAAIQTQSFHAPHTLPEDTPPSIRRLEEPVVDKVRRYVDWSWGNFFQAVEREFPHTILVLIADHGMAYENESTSSTGVGEFLRRTARIPLIFFVPHLPKPIAGSEINTLASNLDVAPTLLSLLEWNEFTNAFMGHDAFSRHEPIRVQDFLLRKVEGQGTQLLLESSLEVKTLPAQVKLELPNLVANDRLLPHFERTGRELRLLSGRQTSSRDPRSPAEKSDGKLSVQ